MVATAVVAMEGPYEKGRDRSVTALQGTRGTLRTAGRRKLQSGCRSLAAIFVQPDSGRHTTQGGWRDGRSTSPVGASVLVLAGALTLVYNTRDFNIRVSADGILWTLVSAVTGSAVTGNTANSTTVLTPTAPGVKFVQLNVARPTQTFDAVTRIYEFEAWGYPC